MRGLSCCAAALAIAGIAGLTSISPASAAPNAPRASADSATEAIAVELPLAVAPSRARAESAMAANGLAITAAEGDVITGTYTDGALTVEIHATVIAIDSTHTRVVVTGFGSAPAMFGLPKRQAQVTSKTGGSGRKAWARMEQIASAIAPVAG